MKGDRDYARKHAEGILGGGKWLSHRQCWLASVSTISVESTHNNEFLRTPYMIQDNKVKALANGDSSLPGKGPTVTEATPPTRVKQPPPPPHPGDRQHDGGCPIRYLESQMYEDLVESLLEKMKQTVFFPLVLNLMSSFFRRLNAVRPMSINRNLTVPSERAITTYQHKTFHLKYIAWKVDYEHEELMVRLCIGNTRREISLRNIRVKPRNMVPPMLLSIGNQMADNPLPFHPFMLVQCTSCSRTSVCSFSLTDSSAGIYLSVYI
ncbi:hypothetical protein CBL_08126 [Carabus blaptoides fortunei]